MLVLPRRILTTTFALLLAAGLVAQGAVAKPAMAAPWGAESLTVEDELPVPSGDVTDETDGVAPSEKPGDLEDAPLDPGAVPTPEEAPGPEGSGNEDSDVPADLPPEDTTPEVTEDSNEELDLSLLPENAFESKGAYVASPFGLRSVAPRFNPGYIISDANMYHGNAMTGSQVQSFLNQRVPRCTIGDPNRIAGSKWGNTHIATKCLRDYKMNTANISKDAYCAAYAGRAGETAAQIIAKVGKACGISQRVLLVMLQKEQSLVTDSWPTVRQIEVAMGANCPDSGPNWAANCDPRYFGFQKQVYRAAWLLKYYTQNPSQYRYQAGKTVSIQYAQNPSCGSAPVYLQNKATAALYIYTPYQPGGREGCVSNDKTNFYNLYRGWFGSPTTFFPDVTETHKFFKEIEWMGTSGISTGVRVSDGRSALYEPNLKVSREAMAAFLYRSQNATYKGPAKSPFADVRPGDKFYNEITWMYKYGYSTGIKQPRGKPNFGPKLDISRSSMAAFMYRIKNATYKGPANSPFGDLRRGDKFYNEMSWMRLKGISTGIKQPNGAIYFEPKVKNTRQGMAAFLYRLSKV